MKHKPVRKRSAVAPAPAGKLPKPRRQPTPGEQLAKLCREIALDKKAEDVLVLDVTGLSTVTDFLVICSGNSEPHLKAIANEVIGRLRAVGRRPHSQDGFPASRWVVLDFSDVLVHIFHPETRARYGLEDLWSDAKKVR